MKLPEKIKLFITTSTLNGGADRPVSTLELANKINEIIDYLEQKELRETIKNAYIDYCAEQYEQQKPKEKKESKWVSRTIKRPNWFNK